MSYRLQVRINVGTRDGAGQKIEKPKTLRKEMFRVTPTSGVEGRRGEQVEATVTHLAECRWFEGANPKMTLYRLGRLFRVISVLDREERHRWLDWQLSEVVDGATG